MQHLGNIDDFQTAIRTAYLIAEKEQKIVVIEKAQRKEGSHKYTTYRGWLELNSANPEVITNEQWKNRNNQGEFNQKNPFTDCRCRCENMNISHNFSSLEEFRKWYDSHNTIYCFPVWQYLKNKSKLTGGK